MPKVRKQPIEVLRVCITGMICRCAQSPDSHVERLHLAVELDIDVFWRAPPDCS
jgi:hypothetical protein